MKRGLRFWMSGCAAVISLALAGFGDTWADDGDVDAKSGSWQVSRFDMAQTLQRLEACAEQHGMSVIACWTPTRGATGQAVTRAGVVSNAGSGGGSVLVFATRSGGTPVLMTDDNARPDLPLSLRLRLRSDGQVEVFSPPAERAYGDELPNEVVREMTELPGLVAEALA